MSVWFLCRFLMNKCIFPCRYVMKTMGRCNCTSSMWMVSLTLRPLHPHYPWDRSLSVRRPTPAGNSVPHRSRDTVIHCTVGMHLSLTFSRLMTHTHTHIYICRTAPLTPRRCIFYIYSTNIRTEYFKHAVNSPFFPLQNAVYYIMLPFLVPVLFTF